MIACFVFMVPVFVVLYFVAVPQGLGMAVVWGQVVAAVLILLATAAFFRAAIWVSPDRVVERGYFGGMKRMSRADIGSIMIVETYDENSAETQPQLFIRDRTGKREIRMRGQFWSRENMNLVMSTLDVPVEQIDDSATSELREEFPTLLYWFERRPWIAAAVFAAIIAIIATGLILFFQSGIVPVA
jgi:hypothetical protein